MIAQLSDAPLTVSESEWNERAESPVIVVLRRALYTCTFVSGALFIADAAYLIVHLMKNNGL